MIYIITRIDFDSMENHIGNARVPRVLGYVDSVTEAVLAVRQLDAEATKVEGWDRQQYPQFETKAVAPLNGR